MSNRIFWLGIFGLIFFVVTTVVGGILFPDYSHVKQLISESYAEGTSHGVILRTFGYIPSGICIALFAFLAIRILPKSKLTTIGFIGIGVFYGIGTIMVSVFPCDYGCNIELLNPSISQLLHNLFGALAYLISPVCIILIGIKAKDWTKGKGISTVSILCGSIAALLIILFINNMEGNYIGLHQRIIETTILFWIARLAFYIKNSKPQ